MPQATLEKVEADTVVAEFRTEKINFLYGRLKQKMISKMHLSRWLRIAIQQAQLMQ